MNRTCMSVAAVLFGIFATGIALAQEADDALTNADVVTLTEAGLSASAIVAVIESSGTDFDISVTELAALAGTGVDSAVVEAMVRASGSGRSRTVVPPADESVAEVGRNPPATRDVPPVAAGQLISFGDDTSQWANDGECDDPRFEGPGMAPTSLEEDLLRDATDCRVLFERGEVWLAETDRESFGALAVGDDGGYAAAYDHHSQAEADTAALNACGTLAPSCVITARFDTGMCVVVAVDDAVGAVGWATGPEQDLYFSELDSMAIDQCVAAGGGPDWDGGCWIGDSAWGCNSGSD